VKKTRDQLYEFRREVVPSSLPLRVGCSSVIDFESFGSEELLALRFERSSTSGDLKRGSEVKRRKEKKFRNKARTTATFLETSKTLI